MIKNRTHLYSKRFVADAASGAVVVVVVYRIFVFSQIPSNLRY